MLYLSVFWSALKKLEEAKRGGVEESCRQGEQTEKKKKKADIGYIGVNKRE